MITEQDIREAIAECQGTRHPDARTCMKLAAYYIILDHIQDKRSEGFPMYSYAYKEPLSNDAVDVITYKGDSKFAKLINGKKIDDVLPLVDELMESVKLIMPRLYDSVIHRLKE